VLQNHHLRRLAAALVYRKEGAHPQRFDLRLLHDAALQADSFRQGPRRLRNRGGRSEVGGTVDQVPCQARRLGDDTPGRRARFERRELRRIEFHKRQRLHVGAHVFQLRLEFLVAIQPQNRPLDHGLRGSFHLNSAHSRAVNDRVELRHAQVAGLARRRRRRLTNALDGEFFRLAQPDHHYAPGRQASRRIEHCHFVALAAEIAGSDQRPNRAAKRRVHRSGRAVRRRHPFKKIDDNGLGFLILDLTYRGLYLHRLLLKRSHR